MLSRLSGWALVVLCAAACEAPDLHVDTAPHEAELLLNGRRHPAAKPVPLPYYGIYDAAAVPGQADDTTVGRTRWTIAPPASRWLFPFDFVIETLGAGFGWTPTEHRHSVQTEARPEAPLPDVQPSALEDLHRRAAEMAASR